MTELQPSDLQTFTNGRLQATDPNTATVLDAALQFVRGYCRWHVSPVVVNDIVALDGPGDWGGWGVGMGSLYGGSYYTGTGTLRKTRVGANVVWLPTKRLQSISSVIEDGVALDVTTLQWGMDGSVVKTNNTTWTTNRSNGDGLTSGLQFTFTHGWTEGEAADWRRLVLAVADRMSMVKGLIGPFNAQIGPYRVSAYYGTSRTGTLPMSAGWLDDLTAQIDTKRYVMLNV